MDIYHFIYKTSHINGRYYIGRHSTNNINDGYLGSGRWIKSIHDKTTLSREIIVYATDITELKILEEQHISNNFENPLCMNYIKSSIGLSSEESRYFMNKLIENGTHNFITNHPVHKLIENGTHHFIINHPSNIKLVCPHCNKTVDKSNYNRWHGNKCKVFTGITIKPSIESNRKNSETNSKLKWWNNGIHSIRKEECPDGYIHGRLSYKKNKKTLRRNQDDGLFDIINSF